MGLHTGFFLSFFFSSPPLCFDLQLRRKVQHCWRQSQDVKLSVTSGVSPTSETENEGSHLGLHCPGNSIPLTFWGPGLFYPSPKQDVPDVGDLCLYLTPMGPLPRHALGLELTGCLWPPTRGLVRSFHTPLLPGNWFHMAPVGAGGG